MKNDSDPKGVKGIYKKLIQKAQEKSDAKAVEVLTERLKKLKFVHANKNRNNANKNRNNE